METSQITNHVAFKHCYKSKSVDTTSEFPLGYLVNYIISHVSHHIAMCSTLGNAKSIHNFSCNLFTSVGVSESIPRLWVSA